MIYFMGLSRRQLVERVAALTEDAADPGVLEYGSHVGPNIRLLKERLPADTEYYAVEPNAEAIHFLNRKLPDVVTLIADERGFLAAKHIPPHPVTVSMSIGVMYGMSPRAARRVLDKMLATSSAVILAENASNADGTSSGFIEEHWTFTHPYATWARARGFMDVTVIPLRPDDAHYAIDSFVVAELNGIGAANANYTFVGGGAVPANALLFANRFTDRNRPSHDITAELNLTYKTTTGSVQHNFTAGGFYADAFARDINVTTTYLAEFNNEPRLVNLTVTNPITGLSTIISRNGLLDAGAGYVNNRHEVQRTAIYLADQMNIGSRFKLDIGGRYEWLHADIKRERTSTTITDATTANLSAALRNVIWGNDAYSTAKPKTSAWAIAAGALYKVNGDVSLYLNGSRGYFFPEIRAVSFNALFQPASYTPEIIKLYVE